jgi:hypothetical protein
MFDTWRLDLKLAKIERYYAGELARFKIDVANRAEERVVSGKEEHDDSADSKMFEVLKLYEHIVTVRLAREARSLDVEMPGRDQIDFWVEDTVNQMNWLSAKGRTHVRKLVDEEKTRRFDVKTRWVTKLIIPLLAALIGVIGAITGLVAVLRHK